MIEPAMVTRNPGSLRMLAMAGLTVLLVGLVGTSLRPDGSGASNLGSSTETSPAAPGTPAHLGSSPPSASLSAEPIVSIDLPTRSTRAENGACPAAHLGPVILRADRSLSQPVYVESGARRHIVLWPYGFSARYAPQLEILDDRGEFVAREGDRLDLMGGVTGDRYDFYACHITRIEP